MRNVEEKFEDYIKLKAGNLNDTSYDCSEIADDLVELFGAGTAVYIVTRSGKFVDLNISENGTINKYVNHYFVMYDNKVYDPRFSHSGVSLEYYLKVLYEINEKPNEIDITLSLTDSNLEDNEVKEVNKTLSISSDPFAKD